MAKITGSASMGVKLKIFSDYENVNPHVSISVEREIDDANTTDAQLVDKAGDLYQLCRKYVQAEIEKDIDSAKGGKDAKYAGKKVR